MPKAVDVDDLSQACGNDGFDLTLNDELILGENQSLDQFEIKYYTDENDAENDTNEISNPEDYTFSGTNCTTIYARIQNDQHPGCFDLISFEICIVLPEVGDLVDLEACFSNDGTPAVFNLTQNDNNALNGLDAEEYQ